jgi:hypothetical protein
VVRFLVILCFVTLVICGIELRVRFLNPSFFYQTTALLFLGTVFIVYVIIHEHRRTGTLIVPYLLSIVLKFIVYGSYLFIIIRLQPEQASGNAIFFGMLYIALTLVEIGFLYWNLVRNPRR